MKASDFTIEPPGVDPRILKRRLLVVVVSSIAGFGLFFATMLILWLSERPDLIWLAALSFAGFLPGLYAWMTGWVARWKAAVFGFVLPVGVWILGVLALGLFTEVWRALR